MSEHVRVRFAPSPTGHLHIGGARTAIYNWAFARRHGGTFVLRIDDTDQERSTEENTEAILRALRWLGLDWDEGPEAGGEYGPYRQSERYDIYASCLEDLKASGGAYACFCTPEELTAMRETARVDGGFSGYNRTCRNLDSAEVAARIANGEPHVWRVAVPLDRAEITIEDAIRGTVTWPGDSVDDFILARSDGTPTYMFASVVDDWKMGMTHIIRGDDHLSNTPRQIMVFEALGAPVPVFGHMGLIHGKDGKRLSKRHGATSVEAYRDQGVLASALLNYLSLLGWSLDDTTNVFDADTLTSRFDLSRVSKTPAVWDLEKLEWMNGVYIRDMSASQLVDAFLPWLEEAELISAAEAATRRPWLEMMAPLVSERLKYLSDVVPTLRFLFADSIEISDQERDKVLAKEGAGRSLNLAAEKLAALDDFTAEAIEATLREVPAELDVKPKIAFQAVRVAITGSSVSPPLFESIELLGKEASVSRILTAAELSEE